MRGRLEEVVAGLNLFDDPVLVEKLLKFQALWASRKNGDKTELLNDEEDEEEDEWQ